MCDKKDIDSVESGLVTSLAGTLFEPCSDNIEMVLHKGLDYVLENCLNETLSSQLTPVLDDIPLIKWAIAGKKVFATIRDRLFVYKALTFIKEFQTGVVPQQEIEKRRLALENHEAWVERELEIIIATVDNSNRVDKMAILAEIYRCYLHGSIKFSMFDDLCSITENIFLGDIIQIKADYESEQSEKKRSQAKGEGVHVITWVRYLERVGRLHALGLMRISAKPKNTTQRDTDLIEYQLSVTGRKFAEILDNINFLDGKYGNVELI